MQYIKQFMIIMAFTLVGQALKALIPLPVPASIYGLVLLFLAVLLKDLLSTPTTKEERV